MSNSKIGPQSELDAKFSELSVVQAQALAVYLKEKYGVEPASGGNIAKMAVNAADSSGKRDTCAADSSEAAGSSEMTGVNPSRPLPARTDDAPLRISDRAFERDLPSMLTEARGKWAAYIRDMRVGLFESKAAAVEAAVSRGASIDEVYVRCILPPRMLSVEF